MKRTILMLILIIQLTGCEKIFFEDPDNDIGSIDSQEKFESALTGLYNKLAQIYSPHYVYAIQRYYGDDIHWDDTGESEYDYYESYPTNGMILELWRSLYNTIISSNNIIVQFENVNNIDIKFKYYLGEAYLIRGLCYYNLVRFYGSVPILKNTDVKYNFTLSSLTEIYEFIEKDLIKAIDYLPDNSDRARAPFVTPHRGTAKAILAEIYLSMAGYPLKNKSKYFQAAKIAKEVIDSARYFGFELIPDFADLWKGNQKNNKEQVLTLHFSNSEDPELNNLTYILYILYPYNRLRNIHPEIKFYNNFPVSYRKDNTYETTRCFIIDRVEYCDYYNTIDETIPMYFKKFAYSRDTTNSLYGVYNWCNTAHLIYLYRYAHTLLTYAEAKARSGELDASAYEAVNMIRRRANFKDIHSPSVYDLQPGLTAEQFTDSLVWERAWEFAGEPEGRWFDLLRLEMVDRLLELRYYEENRPSEIEVTEEYYFLPIPDEEAFIISNIND